MSWGSLILTPTVVGVFYTNNCRYANKNLENLMRNIIRRPLTSYPCPALSGALARAVVPAHAVSLVRAGVLALFVVPVRAGALVLVGAPALVAFLAHADVLVLVAFPVRADAAGLVAFPARAVVPARAASLDFAAVPDPFAFACPAQCSSENLFCLRSDLWKRGDHPTLIGRDSLLEQLLNPIPWKIGSSLRQPELTVPAV